MPSSGTTPRLRRADRSGAGAVVVAGVLLCWVLLGALVPAAGAQAPAAVTCEEVSAAVTLAPDDPTRYRVAGTLCSPRLTGGRTVQLLLAGSFYGRSYWDFPVRPGRYSYVRALTEAGYATLAIDRPGVGASDKPPADRLTNASYADVARQLVEELRAGALARYGFANVVLVGHSLGSSAALEAASRYGGVDGVVLTGFLHAFGPDAAKFEPGVYPAQGDPAFADRPVPPGYLTLRPGAAGRGLFYYEPNADADVIARDEATKETTTGGEAAGFVAVLGSPEVSRGVRVPVLQVVGGYDTIFCTPPACPQAAGEGAFYAPEARLQLVVQPDAAHALNLQRNAPALHGIVRDWSDRNVGAVRGDGRTPGLPSAGGGGGAGGWGVPRYAGLLIGILALCAALVRGAARQAGARRDG